MDLEQNYFQQDTICNAARETMAVFREKIPKRMISRNEDFDWPS